MIELDTLTQFSQPTTRLQSTKSTLSGHFMRRKTLYASNVPTIEEEKETTGEQADDSVDLSEVDEEKKDDSEGESSDAADETYESDP